MKQPAQRQSGQQRSAATRHADVVNEQTGFVDNRTSAIAQRKLSEMMAQSPRAVAQREQIASIAGETAQRKGAEEDEPVQKKDAEEAALLQGKFSNRESTTQLVENAAPKVNKNVLQRKNLWQAGYADDMKYEKEQVLVGDGRNGNVYSEHMVDPSANKTDALQQAGIENASVGVNIENETWTAPGQALDDEAVDELDPFIYSIRVPYMKGDKEERMTLEFQHANQFTGYVTSVLDSANDAAKDNAATMFVAGAIPGGNEKFSNKHDGDDDANLVDLTDGEEEKNLDAYTKIAGEGARWQCVREHSASLQNDSIFYTQSPADDAKVWGLDFKALWKTWKSGFGKKYNITNATVVTAITSDTIKNAQYNKAEMRGVDYSLD